MRSYRQYCALAKALDAIGDRWSLLIVRELLIRGPCRYTDVLHGLPGIATNLLVDRLRGLEDAALVARERAAPPVGTDLFRLTPRGAELEPVLQALGRWGAPLLAHSAKTDAFRSYWLSLPAKLHFVDHRPKAPPVTIEVRAGGEPLTIEVGGGAVHTRPGPAAKPTLVLSGPPRPIMGVLSGRLDVAAALAAGLKHQGDIAVLRRLAPASIRTGSSTSRRRTAR